MTDLVPLEQDELLSLAPLPPVDPLAVVAPLSLVLLCVALLTFHLGATLSIAFPALAAIVGLVLVRRQPVVYMTVVWWLWLLTPFLRRLIDQHNGFNDSNPVMLAPYAATAAAGIVLLRDVRLLKRREFSPLRLVFAGIGLGFLVGLAHAGLFPAVYGVLDWLVGPILGFFVMSQWQAYPRMAKAMWRLAASGLAFIGAYGIIQFYFLPSWDKFWMKNAPINSIGSALPEKVRVFSTLNSPGPFALVVLVLLILLTGRPSKLKGVAFLLGVMAFGVSLVRSAWGGWLFGLLVVFVTRQGASKVRSVVTLVVAVPVLFFAVGSGPVGHVVGNRLHSTTNISQDQSFQDRLAFFGSHLPEVARQPVGLGIGSTGLATKLGNESTVGQIQDFDNGFLEIPYNLGLIGALLFLVGFFRLLRHAIRRSHVTDHMRTAATAAVLAGMSQLIFVNSLRGVPAVFIWTALALAVAGTVHARDGAPLEVAAA